jgi:hypothetical protein
MSDNQPPLFTPADIDSLLSTLDDSDTQAPTLDDIALLVADVLWDDYLNAR